MTPSTLSELLHRQITACGSDLVWLAIDAAAANAQPLPDELQQAVEGPAAHALKLNHPEVDRAHWPIWLPLNIAQTQGSDLLQMSIERALAECTVASLRQGQGRRIAGWLLVDESVDGAAQHWARQMLQRRANVGTKLLRLHDPAVLWALWQRLDPAQQRTLLGPVRSWWLLDPTGQMLKLSAPFAEAEAEARLSAPWSDTLWQDIEHIGAFNDALRHLIEPPPNLPHALDSAMRAMQRAEAAGFNHVKDLAAYAMHAIAVHDQFDSHPIIRRALAQTQADQHYVELVAGLSEEDWREVKQAFA